MEPLLKGIISGITISFLIGPIFLALADITITKGWRSGLSYIAGVLD
jgi:threonine/homoserine/homoserine lactone efflux protein